MIYLYTCMMLYVEFRSVPASDFWRGREQYEHFFLQLSFIASTQPGEMLSHEPWGHGVFPSSERFETTNIDEYRNVNGWQWM